MGRRQERDRLAGRNAETEGGDKHGKATCGWWKEVSNIHRVTAVATKCFCKAGGPGGRKGVAMERKTHDAY